MKIYKNPRSAKIKLAHMTVLYNFENGIVTGLDTNGINFYERVISSDIGLTHFTEDESQLFRTLVESDYISDKPFLNLVHPISAYIHLTNKCNLHCIGCYSWNEKRNVAPDLTTDQVCDAIKKLKAAGVENLVFSGGEPLLRSDIVRITEYAKQVCGISSVILITNGTIFNKNQLTALVKNVDIISISIDGFSAESASFFKGCWHF